MNAVRADTVMLLFLEMAEFCLSLIFYYRITLESYLLLCIFEYGMSTTISILSFHSGGKNFMFIDVLSGVRKT